MFILNDSDLVLSTRDLIFAGVGGLFGVRLGFADYNRTKDYQTRYFKLALFVFSEAALSAASFLYVRLVSRYVMVRLIVPGPLNTVSVLVHAAFLTMQVFAGLYLSLVLYAKARDVVAKIVNS